ncbi:MAG: flagellin lysine-N-methylase, partial [Rickettsiales bacterium]|nr:flagellin lysine-N-methylase [Rickettsiales bacterium]
MGEVHPATVFSYTASFECLGPECADTCCRGWDMQMDPVRKALYAEKAPELLGALMESDAGVVMRRDPETGYCIKLEQGSCSIHRDRGTEFLGDACHFYPRITRQFGDVVTMAATLSCPEIARKVLFDPTPFGEETQSLQRLPYSLKDYLPEGVTSDAVPTVRKALQNMVTQSSSAEQAMASLVNIAGSLHFTPPQSWAEGITMLVNSASSRLPKAEMSETDPYLLVQLLAGLQHAMQKIVPKRFVETEQRIQRVLGISIQPETLDLTVSRDHVGRYAQLSKNWSIIAEGQRILRRWLQAQLIVSAFPYAGFGGSIQERAQLIAIRFAVVRLGLICLWAE